MTSQTTSDVPKQPGRKPVPLSTLRGGERGRLQAAELCCEDCELLNAMGMTDQCEIRVCRAAGGGRVGGPCIVQVNATRLGLSRSLARKIMVTVEGAAG